ncbi:hypothetical protein BGZ99_007542 [Dissophora globulifera]|uniref:F-box domain-containing protein n=1 Tax=Dissophora globulifera TaxID=979702 RepID=A0A9P6RDJ6_9FUNG|nr:hypothetical protein BGZ99_007542 [Dissophora globulifera]
MSLALKINPIEIPELLHIVGYHLTTTELKACMLVSRTWYTLFRGYYWHHLSYHHCGVPNLDKYGHLVRRLTTFWATDMDFAVLAGSCHFIQRLDLELGNSITDSALDVLTSNMPYIRDMRIKIPGSYGLNHLVLIPRLKSLHRLSLGNPEHHSASLCDFASLVKVLHDCEALSDLRLERLMYSSYPSTPARRLRPALNTDPPPIPTWYQRFLGQKTNITSLVQNATIQQREPWRKFVPDISVQLPQKIPQALLSRTLDAGGCYYKLTRLRVHKVRTGFETTSTTPLMFLFKKSPNVKDLHIDFEFMPSAHVCQCLDAIAANCLQIEILSIEGLLSQPDRDYAIHGFFERHRPTLRQFKLKCCENIETALDKMPTATLKDLELVHFDSAVYSQRTFHQLMTRCHSLRSLGWISHNAVPLPPPEARIDAFLEPWGSYETLRHVEQSRFLGDESCFEAFFGRLARMERLVSIGMSIEDVPHTVISTVQSPSFDTTHDQEGKNNDNDDQALDLDEHPGGWHRLDSIQELTFMAIPNIPPTSILSHLQLDEQRTQSLLKVFPKLRKIRYRGPFFPLHPKAYKYLKSQKERSISVFHVSQTPSFATE